jgi:HEAT repeat protein
VALAAGVLALWIQREFRPVNRAVRSLRSGDLAARLAAAEVLGRADAADARAVIPALADALGGANAQVSAAAASALGSVGVVAMTDPDARGSVRVAAEALTRALTDRSAEVRAAAATALGQLTAQVAPEGEPPFDPVAVGDALAGAMRDPSDRVRPAVRWALSTIAAATAIAPPTALLAALGPAASADLRTEAISILPAFRTRLGAAMPALVEALSDRDPSVRYRAAGVLGEAGPAAGAAVPALVAVLQEPVGPRPAAPDLAPVAVAPDGLDPACEAARALGRIAPGASAGVAHAAVAALADSLQSDHYWRRNAAAQGLFLIGKGAAAAAPELVLALADSVTTEGDGQRANSWAARALGLAAPGSGTEAAAIAALTRALDSSADGTRAYAADSLARFGPLASSALPRLRALRDDPVQFVSAMASSAVARLEGASVPVGPTDR